MPFKSKAQAKLFAIKMQRGEISKKTFDEWNRATKNFSKLPEHVKKGKKK